MSPTDAGEALPLLWCEYHTSVPSQEVFGSLLPTILASLPAGKPERDYLNSLPCWRMARVWDVAALSRVGLCEVFHTGTCKPKVCNSRNLSTFVVAKILSTALCGYGWSSLNN